MNDTIYITYQTFTDIVNLLDKIQTNISNSTLCSKGFVISPLKPARTCVKIMLANLVAECVNMIERLFDETAPQIQYIVLPDPSQQD